MNLSTTEEIGGLIIHRARLSRAAQQMLVADLRAAVAQAPLFRPETPMGKPMSVRMTSMGRYGWYADRRGYRYVSRHPQTGQGFPPIPSQLLALWAELANAQTPPDCCLLNYYDAAARMGLHQDRDEADFSYPVLSVSLGDSALFRIGGTARTDPTRSTRLHSGDVLIMGGAARLIFHGIDRIYAGTSDLLPQGGRINLTLRRVDP